MTMDVAAAKSSRRVMYGRLDTLPPSAEYLRSLGWVRDLTEEGVEPNPGWGRNGARPSKCDSTSSGASRGKKQWVAKKGQKTADDALLGQIADLDAQLKARDDPLRARLFDKKERREDKRWKWERADHKVKAKMDKHKLWKEELERQRAPEVWEREKHHMKYTSWKETHEMEEEQRLAEERASIEKNAVLDAETRLTVIFDTLKESPIDYWWVEKCTTKTQFVASALLSVLLAALFLFSLMFYEATGETPFAIALLCFAAGTVFFACRMIRWVLYEMWGRRNSFSFLPDAGAIAEWDLRPDAQAVGENKHINPLYAQGCVSIRKPGLLGKRKESAHLISLELLSQLLNPNVLDIDALFSEKRSRVARITRTCHSINLNRFHNVIKQNVVEDTAYFALAALHDRERRIKHIPFRLPLSQALPASAPTWRG